jgi:hypothetical protein
VYLIVAEEIHWRIHLNGWLPPGLRFARAYHMGHHDFPNTRYSETGFEEVGRISNDKSASRHQSQN